MSCSTSVAATRGRWWAERGGDGLSSKGSKLLWLRIWGFSERAGRTERETKRDSNPSFCFVFDNLILFSPFFFKKKIKIIRTQFFSSPVAPVEPVDFDRFNTVAVFSLNQTEQAIDSRFNQSNRAVRYSFFNIALWIMLRRKYAMEFEA